MTSSSDKRIESLLTEAETMATALAENARRTDQSGLSDEMLKPLKDAGFFRLLQSAGHGGLEAGFASYLDLGRILARACGATAWTVSSFAESAALVSRMSPAAQEDVWGKNPAALIAHTHVAGSGKLRPNGKGFVVSGAWPAVGGLLHADWVLVNGLAGGEDSATPFSAIVRRDEIIQHERPYFGGLRGAGFRDIRLDAVHVPAHRVIAKADLYGANPPGAGARTKGLLAEPYAAFAENRLLGMVLGMAEGGYADYTKITRARVSGIGGQSVAQFTHVQARLAEVHADLKTATSLYAAVKENLTQGLTPDLALEIARDRSYIARRSLEVVTRLVRQMGAMGIAEANPVQRHYRDIRTLATDHSVAWDRHMAAFGRQELGLAEAVGA